MAVASPTINSDNPSTDQSVNGLAFANPAEGLHGESTNPKAIVRRRPALAQNGAVPLSKSVAKLDESYARAVGGR
jgi:hypothetical protein